MRFSTEFFCYWLSVTNRTCSIFVPVFWYRFSAPISGMCVMGITANINNTHSSVFLSRVDLQLSNSDGQISNKIVNDNFNKMY